MILWSAAIVLALGLAWFVPAIAIPLVKTRMCVHTLLTSPVKSRASGEEPFFTALADLAKAQGRDPYDYLRYRGTGRFAHFTSGRAVDLCAGRWRYVLVILANDSPIIPGTNLQQLVLLGNDGRILDKFGCHVDARQGALLTEIRSPPDPDGAQLAIVAGQKRRPLHRLRIEDDRLKVLTPSPAETESGSAQKPPK